MLDLIQFLHARRELDVEVFDRGFAEDEAWEEEATGSGERAARTLITAKAMAGSS